MRGYGGGTHGMAKHDVRSFKAELIAVWNLLAMPEVDWMERPKKASRVARRVFLHLQAGN